MAHKKAGGSSRNGRDSNAQRLGLKRSDGQFVTAGSIIVRQRAPNSILAKMSVSARMIPFLLP